MAGAAEDGWRVELGGRPGDERVIGEGVVAVFAGVVGGAAFHFDGDDVERRVVVKAAGLRVEVEAEDLGSGGRHGWRRMRLAKIEMDGSKSGDKRNHRARGTIPTGSGHVPRIPQAGAR